MLIFIGKVSLACLFRKLNLTLVYWVSVILCVLPSIMFPFKTIYIYVKKAVERVGDLKLIRIKIRDLPADTVAQSVENRRDKPRAWVRILASARFLICSVASFLLCYLGEALEGPISTGVCTI